MTRRFIRSAHLGEQKFAPGDPVPDDVPLSVVKAWIRLGKVPADKTKAKAKKGEGDGGRDGG
jgi:hypothetical protein